MTEYKQIKEHLHNLRDELMTYINSNDEAQDLTDFFIKVKEKDPQIYELIMLIYQEIKTTHKVNKKKIISLIDKSINAKIRTIDALIEDKIKNSQSTIKSKTLFETFIDALTFKNIGKAMLLWMSVIIFLFSLYTINKEAFQAVSGDTFKMMESTGTIIEKVKK